MHTNYAGIGEMAGVIVRDYAAGREGHNVGLFSLQINRVQLASHTMCYVVYLSLSVALQPIPYYINLFLFFINMMHFGQTVTDILRLFFHTDEHDYDYLQTHVHF